MGNQGYPTIAGKVTPGIITTQFYNAFNEPYPRTLYDWLAKPMTINDLKEILAGVGSPPALTKYTGTNKFQNLDEQELLVEVDKFQAGIEYDEDTPNHKLWGLISPQIAQLGRRARDHEITLLTQRVVANPTCYDGKALFANDHPLKNGAVNDNLLSGAGTTQENFETDYWASIALLRAMKDDQGEFITWGNVRYGVHVGPNLEEVATKWQQQALVGSGEENILKNRYELYVDVLLPDNDWYLYVLTAQAKLMMHVEYLRPTIKQYKADDNDLIKVSAKRTHQFYPAEYRIGIKVDNA